MLTRKQELEARLAELQARKTAAPAPTVQPEPIPAPGVSATEDAAIAAEAARLMELFRRKPQAGPPATTNSLADTAVAKLSPADVNVQDTVACTLERTTPTTTSLTEPDFAMLRNQKAAEARAADLTKRNEQLEKTLTFVAETLAAVVVEQAKRVEFVFSNYYGGTTFASLAKEHIGHVDRAALALRLFAGYPGISDAALGTLGVDADTISKWQRWRKTFDAQQDQQHWLEQLYRVADGKVKVADTDMVPFIRAQVEAQGIDVDAELKRITHEKAKEFFIKHPTNFDERGRSLQAGRRPDSFNDLPLTWETLDF